MKINVNEIKPGMIIEHKKDYWTVLKTQHVKPGKGGAFNQVELKSLLKGTPLPWVSMHGIPTRGMLKGVRIKRSYYPMKTPAPMIQINSMRIMPTASALKIKANTIRMPRSSVLL